MSLTQCCRRQLSRGVRTGLRRYTVKSEYPTVDPSLLESDGTPDYLRLILSSRVYDVCQETPLTEAVNLNASLNTNIYLKREDLQPVFSFKLRGAYNRIAQLSEKQRNKGVVACSAGNHAQGVAFSAQKLGIPATIVMPTASPSIKYKNVARMGAKVVLYGEDFDSAKEECNRLAAEEGLTDIPPFDDPYVIAGQGTIGLEILRQLDITKLKAIFCCVGGGGLVAGVAAYVKRIAPHVKIIGVETFDADAMHQSLHKGERITLKQVGLFADGAAVKIVGKETFRLSTKFVDEVIRVNTDEICGAMKDVFQETRAVVEPTGAVSVAGVKKYIAMHPELDHSDSSYVSILSGANMNFDRLRFIAERAQLGEGREVFMAATIPEEHGSFKRLISVIHPRAITEFSYRYSATNAAKNKANVYISFSIQDTQNEVAQVLEDVQGQGFSAADISDNEFAKTHARYLVGGQAGVEDERVISFEFPERPGALVRFLDTIKLKWNITMFHYRNSGSDRGKVAVAIAVPPGDNAEFEGFLETLGYPYSEETDNLAYQLFLR